MISKAQATQAANDYVRGFPHRALLALELSASQGNVGLVMAYPPALPAGLITQMTTVLTNAGWTVNFDGAAFVLTVS